MPEKSQGSYLEGNDRRDFSQLPHLSQNEVSLEKAELPKRKTFFSKCGLPEKSQGSYLEGNDRRDFSQLPHLSQNEVSLEKAELPKRKTLDCPRYE